MRKMRYLKTLTAVTLVASMVIGSAMTAMAAASGDAASGDVESRGEYEGGKMKYPALSVTLPTINARDYDYIADPNGLIKLTTSASGDVAKYPNSTFEDINTGIYFKKQARDVSDPSSKNVYGDTSASKVATNENAQDIDVTVKLEQGSNAGGIGSTLAYAASNTFVGTDNELYLAVTDGSNAVALSSSAAAEITMMIAGKPDNYEPDYTDQSGYEYKKKDGASGWATGSFYLTGALNLNEGTVWDDDVALPSIKVTWDYAEHTAPADAAPSIAESVTYSKSSGTDLVVNYSLGAGESGASAVTDVLLQFDGKTYHSINGTWGAATTFASSFTVNGNSVTISKDYLGYVANGVHTLSLIFDNDTDTMITTNVTIQ